jgi:hypothetical protein
MFLLSISHHQDVYKKDKNLQLQLIMADGWDLNLVTIIQDINCANQV